MSQVTQLLAAIKEGDPQAANDLLPLVYEELRTLAAQRLAREASGQTLQSTALVHEAYLRLIGSGEEVQWDSRGHFFAAAAEAMRRILVDNARRKQAEKRGGGRRGVSLDQVVLSTPDLKPLDDLLSLDEALQEFETEDPDKALLVKLRYFAGLSLEETAQALGISVATAKRHWIFARSWLYGRLQTD